MRDIPRTTFLVVVDAFLVGLLIMMLGACAATPAEYGGDSVSAAPAASRTANGNVSQ